VEPSNYSFRSGVFLRRQNFSQRFSVSAIKSRRNSGISPLEFGDIKIPDRRKSVIRHFANLKMTALLLCGLLFQA
jgi:hypothetical protein